MKNFISKYIKYTYRLDFEHDYGMFVIRSLKKIKSLKND